MLEAEFVATPRDRTGSRDSRRLRRGGRLPINLYGLGGSPVAAHIDAKEFSDAVRGHARVFRLKVGPASESAVIHEIQHDTLSDDVVHVDFMRVDLGQVVEVPVPLRLRGPALAEKDGGIITSQMDVLNVRCLPNMIPEEIVVDIRPLRIHDSVQVGDVKLPAGVEAAEEPKRIVLAIAAPRGFVEAETPSEEAEEPEVIGKEGKSEEPGGEGDS